MLAAVASTPMTKSYKMVALRAFVQPATLVGGMPMEELTVRSRRLVLRDRRLLADARVKELADPERASLDAWVLWWRKWPLEHLEGSGFRIVEDRFEVRQSGVGGGCLVPRRVAQRTHRLAAGPVPADQGPVRGGGCGGEVIRNSSGNPILMLGRDRNPDLPQGRGVPVQVDSQWMTFDFMKVAVNIARRSPKGPNELAEVLRGWFGPAAGASGTEHRVRLWGDSGGWNVEPARAEGAPEKVIKRASWAD